MGSLNSSRTFAVIIPENPSVISEWEVCELLWLWVTHKIWVETTHLGHMRARGLGKIFSIHPETYGPTISQGHLCRELGVHRKFLCIYLTTYVTHSVAIHTKDSREAYVYMHHIRKNLLVLGLIGLPIMMPKWKYRHWAELLYVVAVRSVATTPSQISSLLMSVTKRFRYKIKA